MIVKPLTEHHLEFLSLKKAAQARLSLHLLKYHVVGNHMAWLSHHYKRVNLKTRIPGSSDRKLGI